MDFRLMRVEDIIVKKITPKLGYLFHSLDDDTYSEVLYNKSGILSGSWEEVKNPDDIRGTQDNPYPYTGYVEDGVNNAWYYDEENDKTYVFMDGVYEEW